MEPYVSIDSLQYFYFIGILVSKKFEILIHTHYMYKIIAYKCLQASLIGVETFLFRQTSS